MGSVENVNRSRDMVEWMCYQPSTILRSGLCILHQNPQTLNTANGAARSYLPKGDAFATRSAIARGDQRTTALKRRTSVKDAGSSLTPRQGIVRTSILASARLLIAIGSRPNAQNDWRARSQRIYGHAKYAASHAAARARISVAMTHAKRNGKEGDRGSMVLLARRLRPANARNAEPYLRLSTVTSAKTIVVTSAAGRPANVKEKSTQGRLTTSRAKDFVRCTATRGARCTNPSISDACLSAIGGGVSYVDARSSEQRNGIQDKPRLIISFRFRWEASISTPTCRPHAWSATVKRAQRFRDSSASLVDTRGLSRSCQPVPPRPPAHT